MASKCRRAGEIAAAAGSGERAAVTRRHFSISALLALRSSRGQRGANGIRASDAPRARDGSVYVRPLAAEDDSRTARPRSFHSAYYAVAIPPTAWTISKQIQLYSPPSQDLGQVVRGVLTPANIQ